MLYVNNLNKSYGKFQAVGNLTLHIPRGDLFGFVGPNGAGKTTTIRMICGLMLPDGGSISINGVDALARQKEIRKQIGYVPDFFGVYDNLKVREYMDFYGSMYRMSARDIRQVSDDLLELVNLSDKKEAFVDTLSRGMKQRLCVARALIHNPALLILDEPNSGLDPRARVEMKELLLNLKSMGKTIVISSHILSELSEMCNSIGIMNRGSLAAGLPLTWVSEQKDAFKQYLLQKDSVDFHFRGAEYHVDFVGADIFPQGFAAVADHLRDFRGVNMLADIGNGTMNVMYINDRRPQEKKCFTEKYGTHQCMLAVRENLLKLYGSAADETVIDRVLRYGTAEISERYLTAIQSTAREYVAGIFRRLREHEYDPELMKLYVVGGGGCLIKNFGEFDAGQVVINEDICATAKGYEYLAHLRARKGGMV